MSIALLHGTVAERQTHREVGGGAAKRERDGQADRPTERGKERAFYCL